ncbi:VOC family protein [Vibrio breoganii]|uniref:VOC family protein n=1 Tax=Vibrio breoganii TaxID=553239 RepID=UPI000C846584|nr:VOC family protein [Vibrio breoganii]
MMIEIQGIDHVVLRSTQVESMLSFYCNVLGCEVERRLEEEGLTQLRAGNALIDIINVDSPLGRLGGKAPVQNGRNMDHFCLQIAPINQQQLLAYLRNHDVDILPDAIRYGATGLGWSLYVHDPENNVVELKPI